MTLINIDEGTVAVKTKGRYGELFVIIAGICWGLIGLFTRKISSAGLGSIQVAFLRNIFAAAIMFVILLIKDRQCLKIKLKDIWMFIGTGVCSIAFFNICYFKTIQMTSLSVAAIMLYTAPAMVVIMSCIIFKEKITVRKIIALVLAFGGCFLTTGILGSEANINGIGVLIGLGSGLGYALYSIFGSFALKKYDTFTVTFYTFLIATLGLLPFSDPAEQCTVISAHTSVLLPVFLLASVSTVLPFICYTLGLKTMEAGKASIMAFIEPMVATICGIVVFKEKLSISNVAGIVLIFISVVLLNIKARKND